MALAWLVACRQGRGSPAPSSRSPGRLRSGATSRPSSTESWRCLASQCSRKPPPARPELWGSTTASTAWAVTRASMALPPFFNAASAAVLARGLAVTTTADPRAVEMPLLLGSLDSGSSRLIGAAAAGRVLQRLSASSNALSLGSTALDRLVSVLWLVRRTAGLLIQKKEPAPQPALA